MNEYFSGLLNQGLVNYKQQQIAIILKMNESFKFYKNKTKEVDFTNVINCNEINSDKVRF